MSTRLADRLIAARHRRFVGRAAACDPFHSALAAPSRPHVILIDTCETLAPLDGWLRDTFLPQLPGHTRVGPPPNPPLNGRYAGELVMLDIAPGLTQLVSAIVSAWLPWKGKTFDASQSKGANILTRDSLPLAHVYWPLYRGYVDDGPETYRAYAFRTYLAPGLADPDRQVLKIDYEDRKSTRL